MGVGGPLQVSCWILWTSPVVLNSLLAFQEDKMFRTYHAHFLPQLWAQMLLHRALDPFTQKWYLETTIWVLNEWIYKTSQTMHWEHFHYPQWMGWYGRWKGSGFELGSHLFPNPVQVNDLLGAVYSLLLLPPTLSFRKQGWASPISSPSASLGLTFF